MNTQFARHLVFGFAFLGMACPSLAQGPGWTAVGQVARIVNTANGGFNVRMSPELSGCVSQGGYGPLYASVLPTHPGINRIKADLLAAMMSGTQVQLYLTDSNCTIGEAVIGGHY